MPISTADLQKISDFYYSTFDPHMVQLGQDIKPDGSVNWLAITVLAVSAPQFIKLKQLTSTISASFSIRHTDTGTELIFS